MYALAGVQNNACFLVLDDYNVYDGAAWKDTQMLTVAPAVQGEGIAGIKPGHRHPILRREQMSMDKCSNCDRSVDTDYDTEFYGDNGNGFVVGYDHHYFLSLCERCRDLLEKEIM